MALRKVFAVTYILLFSVPVAQAGDFYYIEPPRKNISQIQWDTQSIQSQTQSVVYLRARVTELAQENEQLRNSIAKLKSSKSSGAHLAYDARIQALIDENKRLSQIIARNDTAPAQNTDVYAATIQKLQSENAMLKSKVSIHDDGRNVIYSLQKEVGKLQQENIALKENAKKKDNINTVNGSAVSQLHQKEVELLKLHENVRSLEDENRKLGQALADSSSKLIAYQENVQNINKDNDESAQTLKVLRERLAGVEKEKKILQDKLADAGRVHDKQGISSSRELESLKQQNERLRETIGAQNDVLKQADNASQTAEKYLSENLSLKKQLEQLRHAHEENAKASKDLFVLNEKLRDEIAKRDQYITELEGLKETVHQLQNAKQAHAKSAQNENSINVKTAQLENEIQSLQDALNKERDRTVEYRTKIREYQEQLETLKSGASEEMAQQISGYKAQLDSCKNNFKKLNDDLSKKNVELQDLRAQIELLKEEKHTSFNNKVSSGKMELIARADESVTYVETAYPPVEQVAPLLDKDGHQIYSDDQVMDEPKIDLVSEELLAQEPRPLKGNQ